MANKWKFRVTETRVYEVDFSKDVTDETEAHDLFERGHFLPGYKDEIKTSHIDMAVPK